MHNGFGLAHYPKGFLQCVVSPTKICMQFAEPQVKFRTLGKTNKRKIEIEVQGTDFEQAAVGCQMPTIEAAQLALIDAYLIYAQNHLYSYTENYHKDFKDFLIEARDKLNKVIQEI